MRHPPCVYCGLPRQRVSIRGRVVTLLTCRGHTDLLDLDPKYNPDAALAGDDDERDSREREVAMPP